jgi:hypothetical protein
MRLCRGIFTCQVPRFGKMMHFVEGIVSPGSGLWQDLQVPQELEQSQGGAQRSKCSGNVTAQILWDFSVVCLNSPAIQTPECGLVMEHRTRASLRAMAQKGWNPRYIFRHSSPSEGFRHPPSETSLYRSRFDSWATLAVSAASASMWEGESHPRRRRIDPPSRRSYVLI